MNELKRKVMEFNGVKEDIDSRMNAELQQRKKLKIEVQIWLENVERVNGEVQKLNEQIDESITLTHRFHADDVLKRTSEVEELLQQGKFQEGLNMVFHAAHAAEKVAIRTSQAEVVISCAADDVLVSNYYSCFFTKQRGLLHKLATELVQPCLNTNNCFSLAASSVFNGEGFHIWVVKMRTYLQAFDLWEVANSYVESTPLRANPIVAQIRQHANERTKRHKAMSYIQNCVSDVIFTRILACETPKQA
ncbi:putative LRR receptor-like serine/threonine-protein kinase [Gossypium australe]|uniref:Putative LRR receptor-like serine/threonine-protein kinase n=1 Tax=Gossypium australe TaxID=47621 RepID=A0A5B6VU38_9ROSI|nr:putative LRR receptor-like serine/threonine-protein kinase [Gossypium australe]